jgi:chromate transporter
MPPPATGTAPEVFTVFLRLGLTSFGGPIAHLGYFRTEFVERRKWLSESAYADLVALCQFLPGPASSQVGFALGLQRAGWAGALAAFAGFTLPSALMMLAFGLGMAAFDGPLAQGALTGLKIVAVAIVAQAVLGMARNLCPDGPRAGIAVAAVVLLAFVPGSFGMVLAIILGAGAGALWLRGLALPEGAPAPLAVTQRGATLALGLFLALLLGLPLLAGLSPQWSLADNMYRAGALVFGGGHVVLPLLEAGIVTPGLLPAADFLAAYGAAQAVPGPLFTFAAALGAGIGGVGGAALALSLGLWRAHKKMQISIEQWPMRLIACASLAGWLLTAMAGRWIAYADYIFWQG